MKEIDYTIPLIVSLISLVLLSVFYLYKTENGTLMRIFSSWVMKTRYSPAKYQKDTRGQDSILLVVLTILIFAFALKIISFAVVISDSMRPEFQRGDIVLTQTIFKDPQKGDIVTFKASGVQNPITHRVVNVQQDIVTTKGDNNPLVDDYGTTRQDVLAKAVVVGSHPLVIKGVGSLFILDFSKEGKLNKFGDQFTFLQQVFVTIRTWGYVITIIAFSALIMSMMGSKR
ncbi:MAG: signal peptidase I [Candidatus Methanoperedens sp.]|nr:signal peptidase I [Candidatus Methanoperedens sp.]MCZ7370528.1 signal peptidase I [Candidatus Methanoperedens sp.]